MYKYNKCYYFISLLVLILIVNNDNLVKCTSYNSDDDSLDTALDVIYRRQRGLDAQDNEYYGQPEDIGYGFQKNFGFFDSGPAKQLGRTGSGTNDDEAELRNMLAEYLNDQPDKRDSNFRERNPVYLLNGQRQSDVEGIEYLELLKNLWKKYQKQRDNYDLEDLTKEDVEEMLSYLSDEDFDDKYGRNRRNYRVFDGLRAKRYPSLGRLTNQHVGYQPPAENNFLYSLKYVNPYLNRDAVESLSDGYQTLGDERDEDVLKILQDSNKRNLKHFKQHSGIHMKKRPVKRSPKNDKITKELENIFGKKNETEKKEIHVQKKSIDWSQYFGVNKRNYLKNNYEKQSLELMAPKSKKYWHKRDYSFQPFDTRVFNTKRLYNADVDSSIKNMEDKIDNIENKILDDAVRYTGSKTGSVHDQEQVGEVKNQVINHLEAAYSLQKMKNALEEFKNTVRNEKSFDLSTEQPKTDSTTVKAETQTRPKETLEEVKKKKTSVKKESVEELFGKDNGQETAFDWPVPAESDHENDDCPILDHVLHNCLRIEEINGQYAELLLPLCTLHQICYMCGPEVGFSRASSCDLLYLSEARNLCQVEGDCLASAKETMLALRDIQQEESLESPAVETCLASPCIQKFFVETPAAIVPLEFQRN